MISNKRQKTVKGICLAFLMVWTLFPIYWMFTLSIRSLDDLNSGFSFYPRSFSLDNFIGLFTEKGFLNAILNSLFVTCTSLCVSLVFGVMCSYILSRARFKFGMKGPMLFWVLLIRILPPISLALPLYIMMTSLGIINTMTPIVLAHILINVPFIIWFLLSFFQKLPVEVEESAMVDGASEWQMFTKIVLPQVLPGLTAVGILSFMTSWNEYLYGVIFVQDPQNFTIPLLLSTMNSEQELTQWGMVASGGVISLIPVLFFVIFAQNFLISGLSSGAVKE